MKRINLILFFGLDDEAVNVTKNVTTECLGKGKGVALEDDEVVDITEQENENSDSEDNDMLVDKEHEFVDVQVDMEDFDRTNAKTMGNDDRPQFNADEEFDTELGIYGLDNDEFESASDEDPLERITTRKLKKLRRQN